MDVKWIKISVDMFNNRKIKQIKTLLEGDAIIAIWVEILCLAGSCNNDGYITITKEIPYTDKMLAIEFNRSEKIISLALKTFVEFGMVEIVENIYMISNWEKYQNTAGLEAIREKTKTRVRNFREKKKGEKESTKEKELKDKEIDIDTDIVQNVTCNVTKNVTCNVTETLQKRYERDNSQIINDFQSFHYSFLTSGPTEWINFDFQSGIAWKNLFNQNPTLKPDELIKSASEFKIYCKSQNISGRYVKSPQNWLNEGGYRTNWLNLAEKDKKLTEEEELQQEVERIKSRCKK